MTKRIDAKHKIDRRLGVNLWGRNKSPINSRAYAPGQHGMNKKKPTDYGVQLLAKQKLRSYYGNLTEGQFKRIYQKAITSKGDTVENMIALLERRLDAVIYRMKFAPTVFSARQFISHGHVMVNGKTVNIASYSIKDGDEIAIKDKMKQNEVVLSGVQSSERGIPAYVDVDVKNLKGKFIAAPKFLDVPYPVMMEPNLVIEFYSR